MSYSIKSIPTQACSVTLESFFDEYCVSLLPEPSAAAKQFRMLKHYLFDEPDPIFVVRRCVNYLRGKRYTTSETKPQRFICSDNEAALWFYGRSVEGNLPSEKMADLVVRQLFPIGFAKKKIEKHGCDWSNWGRKDWEKAFGKAGWLHAHLLDAAKDRGDQPLTLEELRLRCLRFLCVANHFPIPSFRRFTNLDTGTHGDFGAIPEVKSFFMGKLSERYSSFWSEFWKLAQGEGEVSHDQSGNYQLRFEVKGEIHTDVVQELPEEDDYVCSCATRFRVDEKTYQQLARDHQKTWIHEVRHGTAVDQHPNGSYVIPNIEAITFIERKRTLPCWQRSRSYSSNTIPRDLRPFFRNEP